MPSDILQQFLDKGLLDVGDDNEKFSHVEKAAEELAKSLKKNRRALLRSTSLLFSEQLPEADPVVALCEAAVKKQWPPYRSRFQNNPSELFRATLLQAVAHVTKDSDPTFAGIVFYSGSSLLPYQGSGPSEPLFRHFYEQLGQRIEAQAEGAWTTAGDSDVKPVFEKSPVSVPSANSSELAELLKDAAGPAGGDNPNPQWPSSNSAQWLTHYGTYTAEAINWALEVVLEDLTGKLIGQFRSDIEKVAQSKAQGSGEDHRVDLLYWKETLYSPSQKTSYRDMLPDAATYWMAYDLHCRVPNIHPHSLEFFLRETLRQALKPELAEEAVSPAGFASVIANALGQRSNEALLPAEETLPLLDFIGSVADGQRATDDIHRLVGITSDELIPRVDFLVWLFRDFQARRLAGGK